MRARRLAGAPLLPALDDSMSGLVSYAGKRVVVSGCASGIGAAVARGLLDLGAEVHGLDFRPCDLRLAAFDRFDLGDPASIATAADRVHGRVDALFNCAGLAPTLPPLDVIRVNFLGTRELTEQLLPRMAPGAAIVSIASLGGLGWPDRITTTLELVRTARFRDGLRWAEANLHRLGPAYAFSKEAVIVWTMASACALVARGVRVNCTLPGVTQTPMMDLVDAATPRDQIELSMRPSGRRSSPEEQARVLLFLNSDAARYVNGVAMPVDGGFMAALPLGALETPALP